VNLDPPHRSAFYPGRPFAKLGMLHDQQFLIVICITEPDFGLRHHRR